MDSTSPTGSDERTLDSGTQSDEAPKSEPAAASSLAAKVPEVVPEPDNDSEPQAKQADIESPKHAPVTHVS